MEKIEIKVPFLPMARRIDAYLAESLAGKFSRSEIKEALESQQILLNGKPAKAKSLLKEGDKILGAVNLTRASGLVPENIPLSVIYEDESLLVIDKPAGLVVHPGTGNKKGTLVHALLGRGIELSSLSGADRPGIVHRLDKDTSGLIVVAKNNAAHRMLQAQFAERTFTKVYMALVKGVVDYEQGRILEALGRDPKVRTKMAVSKREDAKEAQTYYTVLKRFKRSTLVRVKILTGRTHQIRVHFAHLGHPVEGDVVYGRADQTALRLALHAAKIEFIHPKTGKIMRFESPLPPAFEKMIELAEKE